MDSRRDSLSSVSACCKSAFSCVSSATRSFSLRDSDTRPIGFSNDQEIRYLYRYAHCNTGTGATVLSRVVSNIHPHQIEATHSQYTPHRHTQTQHTQHTASAETASLGTWLSPYSEANSPFAPHIQPESTTRDTTRSPVEISRIRHNRQVPKDSHSTLRLWLRS